MTHFLLNHCRDGDSDSSEESAYLHRTQSPHPCLGKASKYQGSANPSVTFTDEGLGILKTIIRVENPRPRYLGAFDKSTAR